MGWFGRNHMPVEGRTILLTGGSEGTGLSAARIFSSRGANIIIVSRNPAKLEEAVKSIKAAAKSPEMQRFHTIVADVAEPNYAEGVVNNATAWNDGYPPEIVWCLAGLSTPMLWTDDGALQASRYNMDVNYFGTAEMSRAIMRAWLLPGQEKKQPSTRGSRPAAKHIVFTGTVLSVFSMAGHGTYAPSKFALRALADALAMEVRLYPDVPIEVHFILPNSITTAGYERENETKPEITLQLEGAETPQDPDTVARLSIAGVEKGRYFVTTSFIGDLMRWGAMGNSPRNNWFVDTLMGCILPFIMAFVTWDMNSQVSRWGNKRISEESRK
ncbi:3-ketodihydrosphingosine reductase tsc-10 [Annulohypoxylon truncatum]|uniref:3-ketodihydrosphingosine reductase tsc-10 n=1 Tax=Annulohypoxylon truncatum TaxID=327061 RepID=UPI00200787F6|nr:3-ketodihydrosphingosine reductase tsc-10 [Annulohypoxylon truncatum]KAI1206362.1 3-ketodihydrosphingosine reductase tsc-10 [Annulohypoxylon truncatum]